MEHREVTMKNNLHDFEQPAYSMRNIEGKSLFVITCDHASFTIPEQLGNLGVSSEILNSHIGWDIGALSVSKALSDYLDAPLLYTNFSRLVIDCNRPPGISESIPTKIHEVDIPGNKELSLQERKNRINMIFYPYHKAISSILEAKIKKRKEVFFLAIHSFTPQLKGKYRPWPIGITYETQSCLSRFLLEELSKSKYTPVGENEPYPISPDGDYGVREHGEKNRLASVLIEIRQDLLQNKASQKELIEYLKDILYRFESSSYYDIKK